MDAITTTLSFVVLRPSHSCRNENENENENKDEREERGGRGGGKFEQKKEKVVGKLINLLNFRGNRL